MNAITAFINIHVVALSHVSWISWISVIFSRNCKLEAVGSHFDVILRSLLLLASVGNWMVQSSTQTI